MSGERRRWRRLRSELGLQLHVDEDTGNRIVSAIGSHLNPTGIFVQMSDPPPLGARVRVTLEAEGTDGVLTAAGEVVDRVVPNDTTNQPPGIGIRLEQTGPAWTKLYKFLLEDGALDSQSDEA
jgi:Tfp pilus assembly protein PilZ